MNEHTNRWNIEVTKEGVRICAGEHHRSQDCEWIEYVPKVWHDAIAARLAALEESTVAANNSQLRLIDRLAEAQEQAKADRLVVDEAYRNERIAKARLVDKNILLAQAVEYGNDYKRERDDLMVNYQATLARLAEAEALLKQMAAWRVAIECVAPELGGVSMTLARIDAHLAADSAEVKHD